MRSICRPLLVLACLVLASTAALAQVTTSIAGVVVDVSGAFIPGATITVKNNATTAESHAVSGENGTFAIPALNAGTYTVTVTLPGFKTAVVNDVVLTSATPGSVKVTLEVGGREETVNVSAGTEIIHTQTPAISTTVDANRIINLPLGSRSGLDFVVNLPGVQTPGGSRDSQINGLPQSAISITWDGVNVQDNHLKTTDGFFAIISPRLDAIEEVTLTTAAQGAEATGQGAARINFVTRSGSNTYTGSAYHYYRNDALNANTFSRNRDGLPKANLLQNQPGVRFGGPIWIPKLFNGRDRAFFFVNYEQFRQPGEFTVTRTILHPLAQQGIFRYNTAGAVQEVNLLQIAVQNGHLATVDPTIGKLLSDIRASTNGIGSVQDVTNPSHQSFSFPGASSSFNYYPTVRIDYNLTEKHRLTGTVNYQSFENYPDQTNNREVRFPGFPNTVGQTSWRTSSSFAVRSTLGANLVNEARVAYVNYEVDFSAGISTSHWTGSVANQAGYNLSLGFGLTNPTTQANMSGRQAPVREFINTLNWLAGSHSVSIGGSFTNVRLNQWSQRLVPQVTFGIDSTEPVNNLFNTANFPNASNTNLNDARALYALLTGRVATIVGDAVLNPSGEYIYNGMRRQEGSINEIGLFVQDSWRVRPGLTLNAGLRWELQRPFAPSADNYTTATYADVFGISGLDANGNPNLFQPGVMTGRPTEFVQFSKGTRAYTIDYGNVAPTAGFAWTPRTESGWLRRMLGRESDSVIRGGYAMAFSRNGMSDYSGIFGSNPGSQIVATRSAANGTLNLDGQGLPVLFRQDNRLGPPPFATTPDYPLTVAKGTAQVTNSVNVFDPEMKTPHSHSWTLGWQRALTSDMVAEIRYVGSRGKNLWATINYNEFNILENGFLDEFRRAQANLQANIAAGRAPTFAYTGEPGTSPLPAFLAFFNGINAAQAGDPARYTGNNWTNSTFLGYLARFNPQPFNFAAFTTGNNDPPGLLNDAGRRANAAAAGLVANYFVVNPGMLGGANVRTNNGFSHYDSLQLELRRRLSNGLQMQASYAFGDTYTSDFYSVRRPLLESIDTGAEGTVGHAFKTDWVYELPFGRGRRFASNINGVLDRIIGGWSIAGIARIQSGEAVDFGNIRLVGMTVDDLKNLYGLYEYPQVFSNNPQMRFYRLPQDIIENTVRAFAVSATSPTGYGPQGPPTGRYLAPANGPDCIETIHNDLGECGLRSIVIHGPKVWFADLSVVKRIEFTGRLNAEFRAEFLNAFNHPVLRGETAPSIPEAGDNNGIVTPSGNRVIQLVARLNW